jgi:hypothetical protein
MAHQLKTGDGSVTFSNRNVLERPQLAALLGAISAEWAAMEGDLVEIYATVMGYGYIRIPKTLEEGMIPYHPVALQIFEAVETRHHRILLLSRLIKWIFPEFVDEFKDKIIPAINLAAKSRNKFEHARWGLCDKYPNALIHVPILGKFVAYYESDFNESLDRIVNARHMVFKLERRVLNSAKRKNPLIKGLATEE